MPTETNPGFLGELFDHLDQCERILLFKPNAKPDQKWRNLLSSAEYRGGNWPEGVLNGLKQGDFSKLPDNHEVEIYQYHGATTVNLAVLLRVSGSIRHILGYAEMKVTPVAV